MCKRLTVLFAVLLPFVAVGCSSPTNPGGNDDDDDDPVVAPEVTSVEVKMLRDDMEWGSSSSIANLEGVQIRWETAGGAPDSCTKTRDWNGSITKTWGGTDTTRALPGPEAYTFGVYCENSAGSDEAVVTVDVGAPGAKVAITDRPDPTDQPMVKVVYLLPSDSDGRDLARRGWLTRDVVASQNWLDGQMSKMLRFDTYNGGDLDIATIRLDRTAEELSNVDVYDLIETRLEELDLLGSGEKTVVAYYDGPCKCGGFGKGNLAMLTPNPDIAIDRSLDGTVTLIHEIFHTFGIVDKDAPDNDSGLHIGGPPEDIMAGNVYAHFNQGVVLDYHGRNYYCPETGDCGEYITDLQDEEVAVYFTEPYSSYTGLGGSN